MRGKGFQVIDQSECIRGIVVKGLESVFTNKEINDPRRVKRPQIGAKGMIYIKYSTEGVKSSISKFPYTETELLDLAQTHQATQGDVILYFNW